MPSLPITDAGAQPDRVSQLLELLATVPDPRDARGVRYRLAGVLAVAVTAVLAGARSFAAIGEWAADLSGEHLARIGLGMAPEESTCASCSRAWMRTRWIGCSGRGCGPAATWCTGVG